MGTIYPYMLVQYASTQPAANRHTTVPVLLKLKVLAPQFQFF